MVRQLPEEVQNALADRSMTELSEDDAFDRKIAATVAQLDWLIEEARDHYRAGRTEEMDPERL